MKIFGVIGKPILHSRSPELFNAAFKAAGEGAEYIRILAQTAREGIDLARSLGLSGFNVTAPFKNEILNYLTETDEMVQDLRVANTALFANDRIMGFNTDIFGVCEALRSLGSNLNGKLAIVVGAGGAAQAALKALQMIGSKAVITNRSEERGRELARRFGVDFYPLQEDALRQVSNQAGLIISCASTGQEVFPSQLIGSQLVVLDGYYAAESALLQEARRKGARIIPGETWLCSQAQKSFEIFTGKRLPCDVFTRSLDSHPLDLRRKPIALLGLMGSGKSEIGKLLAALLHLEFIDMDVEIEKSTGMSIDELFQRHGEVYFRSIESTTLEKIAKRDDRYVLSCGGGVVNNSTNVTTLRNRFMGVWLYANTACLTKRISSIIGRPLLLNVDINLTLSNQLVERKSRYAASSQLVINTEGKPTQSVAFELADEINQTTAH